MAGKEMLNSSRLTDMREVRSGCVYLDSSHHQPRQCSQLKGKSGSDPLLVLPVLLVCHFNFHNFRLTLTFAAPNRSNRLQKARTGGKLEHCSDAVICSVVCCAVELDWLLYAVPLCCIWAQLTQKIFSQQLAGWWWWQTARTTGSVQAGLLHTERRSARPGRGVLGGAGGGGGIST